MGKGPVNSDSIGNSSVYNNPYDTRNFSNPAMQKHRADAYMNSKDVLQANLEKDLLSRLEDGYLRLPRGGLIYLVVAGKFMLYMITLPPYLLFYGLPKWLLQNQLPKLNKVLIRLKEIFENQIKNRLIQIKNIFKSATTFSKRRFGYLAQIIQKRLHPAQQFLKRIAKKLQNWNESANEFRYQVRKFFIYLPNKLVKHLNRLVEAAENKFKGVKNRFTPFQRWLQETNQQIENRVIWMEKQANSIVNKLVVQPFNAVKSFTIKIQQQLQKALTPPINWVKQKGKETSIFIEKRVVKPIAEMTRKVIEKTKEVILPRLEKMRKVAENVSKRVEGVTQQVTQPAQAVIQTVITPAINLFASLTFTRTSKDRGVTLRKSFIKKVSKAKNHLYNGSKKLYRMIKRGGRLLKKTTKTASIALKRTSLKLWRFLLKVISTIIQAIKETGSVIHLMITWMRVLFRYTLIRLQKNYH